MTAKAPLMSANEVESNFVSASIIWQQHQKRRHAGKAIAISDSSRDRIQLELPGHPPIAELETILGTEPSLPVIRRARAIHGLTRAKHKPARPAGLHTASTT